MEGIPVIRIELERMKKTLLVAINERFASLDMDVRAAVEKVCTPEHIATIIEQQAAAEIKAAITEEVSRFYRWGNGREAIKAAVAKMLDEQR